MTQFIKATLDDGSTFQIQVTPLGGEEKVAFTLPSFKEVTNAIEGIAHTMISTIQAVKPRKACVEFGIDVGFESGQLTALLVKGTGTSNIKITLEWTNEEAVQPSS